MISPITTTNPGAIAAELHKQQTAAWWADPEYQAIEAEFLLKNPICEYCGRPATLAHHDDPRSYHSKEAYYNLDENGTPACGKCHWMYRRGFVICPVCKRHYMKPGAEKCWHCRGGKKSHHKRVHHGRKAAVHHPCQRREKYQGCRNGGTCNYSWRRARECTGFVGREAMVAC